MAIVAKGQEPRYVLASGGPLIDSQQRKVGAVVAMHDITETKKAAEALQRRTEELARSNAELEQFAYVASHDLQEPLRTVSSFLTLIDNKYSGALDEAGQKYIAFAVDGAKRMRQIILDLLEFSRVGQMLDEKQSIDLNGLVNEVWQACSQMVQEKNAQLRVDELPVITAYKTPLMQVFQNLISNAVKYCKKEVQPQINITASEFKNHWQFAISDNGLGIDSKYFVKIFVIFQRLHAKDSFTGTGIGLAVTKKIIENMGGKIWVESEEGKGSTFYFTIPK
jgi:light-regulated signal transduction histidine kinase (bacteriophytochrome)